MFAVEHRHQWGGVALTGDCRSRNGLLDVGQIGLGEFKARRGQVVGDAFRASPGRRGAQAAIGLAAVLAAAWMRVIAGAPNTPALAVGVLVSVAAGLAFPPHADLVARCAHPRCRDLAWSTISSGTSCGVVIAGPIAIAAGDRWSLAWMVSVGIAVGTGIVAVLLTPGHHGIEQDWPVPVPPTRLMPAPSIRYALPPDQRVLGPEELVTP